LLFCFLVGDWISRNFYGNIKTVLRLWLALLVSCTLLMLLCKTFLWIVALQKVHEICPARMWVVTAAQKKRHFGYASVICYVCQDWLRQYLLTMVFVWLSFQVLESSRWVAHLITRNVSVIIVPFISLCLRRIHFQKQLEFVPGAFILHLHHKTWRSCLYWTCIKDA